MAFEHFNEGVRPGGLTASTEIRILLCYILDMAPAPVSRRQLEGVLLGEELVNYFAMAESLQQLAAQNLVVEKRGTYTLTEQGRAVAQTLARSVPLTVRETALRGVILAQQYAAKKAVHQAEVEKAENRRSVKCRIGDEAGPLFELSLYMPDDLSAAAARELFIDHGDAVYKLVLAALTENQAAAKKALEALGVVPNIKREGL